MTDRDVFGDEQIDAWLKENCRRSGPNWVWPRGTTYTQEQSREIVRVHLTLGMGPTEMITVEMIGHLLRRIESLERLFAALGAPDGLCPCVHPATGLLCVNEDRHIGGHLYTRSPVGVQA